MLNECVIFISPCALMEMEESALKYVKSLGLSTVIVMDDINLLRVKADYIIQADTGNAASIITELVEFSKSHVIKGILTYSDYHVEVTALANEYFGLRGTSYPAALTCKNKYLCRSKMCNIEVAHPKFKKINTDEDMKLALAEIGTPMVVKPINGLGSMFTSVISSSENVMGVFQSLKKSKSLSPFNKERAINDSWIAEGCLSGFQVSVESFTYDSVTTVICVHDKLNEILPPLFRVIYSGTPSERINLELERELISQTKSILQEIEFENGIAHTEFRISSEGKIQLLEVNARTGGGLIVPSAYYSTGINLYQVAVDIAIGQKPNISPVSKRRPVVFRVVYPDRAGKIRELRCGDGSSECDLVKVLEILSKTGDIVGEGQRLAMILLQGGMDDHVSSLVKKIDEVVASWNIAIEPTSKNIPLPKHVSNSAHK